jgi:hypothetical protein
MSSGGVGLSRIRSQAKLMFISVHSVVPGEDTSHVCFEHVSIILQSVLSHRPVVPHSDVR